MFSSSFSSMLVALLLMIAGATVLVMIEMTGKREDGQRERKKKIRRVLGYFLFFLFFLVVFLLLNNAGGFAYPDDGVFAWGGVHIILALLLLVLVLVRLFFIKLHIQGSSKLIVLGIILFGFIFILVGVTIGYYIFTPLGAGSVTEAKMGWVIGATVSDQDLMGRKCSKCHSLERIFVTYKEKKDWQQTVQRMAKLDYPNISDADAQRITAYLVEQQQRREKSMDHRKNGKNLVSRKCGICHDLDRVFGADKTLKEWEKTVDDMIKLLGVSNFLSTQEKKDLIVYLGSRKVRKVQPASSEMTQKAEALVARKCSAGCHALDRVLRVSKTPQQWKKTIESMEAMTGKKDFLSKQEEERIIHWLIHRKQSDLESPENVHTLVSGECISCHDLEKLFQYRIKEELHPVGETR
jgi:hypothetical protein